MTPDQIRLQRFLDRADANNDHVLTGAEIAASGIALRINLEEHDLRPVEGRPYQYTVRNDVVLSPDEYRAFLYVQFNLLPREAREAIAAAGITDIQPVRISDLCHSTNPNNTATCRPIEQGRRVLFTEGPQT